MKKYLLLLCCVLFTALGWGQGQKFWLSFKGEAFQEWSLDSLANRGMKAENVSRWLNAVSVVLSEEEAEEAKQWAFVDSVFLVNPYIYVSSTEGHAGLYAQTFMDMKGNAFRNAGLDGKGVSVGIIDAGFHRATADPSLKHIFVEGHVKGFRDFINPDADDFFMGKTSGDYHGRMVWRMVAGEDENTGRTFGFAPEANFYLARTENGEKEHRVEEDDWISAIEWLDSMGVKLVNTSLGYAQGMDDSTENYQFYEMDGRTAMITRAAQIAVEQKDMFLVVSAGNAGETDWRIVSAPADAQGVLSVGATKLHHWLKQGYSSEGPDFLPYLKPDVACFSPNGTSFSAPAVTGFVACLIQHSPDLSMREIRQVVEKSAHLYPYGNNYIGYGVPQADRALTLLENPDAIVWQVEEVRPKSDKVKLDLGNEYLTDIVLFHKKDSILVAEQTLVGNKDIFKKRARKGISGKLFPKRGHMYAVIHRPDEHILRTTVEVEGKVYEIFWE